MDKADQQANRRRGRHRREQRAGEATARHLAQEGAKLVLGVRRLGRLTALAEELGLPADAAVQLDVTDHDQVRRLVDGAVAAHGRIDVIVNNAGLMPVKRQLCA